MNKHLAIAWQRIAADSARRAMKYMEIEEYRMAAYYQQQAAREHARMTEFLKRIIPT